MHQERKRHSAKERKLRDEIDWRENYGKKAYAAARSDFKPPTYAVRDPNADNKYVFHAEHIHDLFLSAWGKVYRRHAASPLLFRRS